MVRKPHLALNIPLETLISGYRFIPRSPSRQEFAALVERMEQLRHKQREIEKELENLFGSFDAKVFWVKFIELKPFSMSSSKIDKNEKMVISYLTMRKAVGWLGMSLPFLLLAGNYAFSYADVFNNPWFVKLQDGQRYETLSAFKGSVSHYYYTAVGEIFTGIISAVALFLFCYRGHPIRQGDKGLSDSTMTTLAGFFALGVAMFPTSSDDFISDSLRNFLSSDFIGYIHYGFAAAFFVTLAFMCIINFRRAEKQELFGTGPDDPFYLRCGIIMLAALALVPVFSYLVEPRYEWAKNIRSTFILEAIALFAFGLSWLKKGKADIMYIPKKLKLSK